MPGEPLGAEPDRQPPTASRSPPSSPPAGGQPHPPGHRGGSTAGQPLEATLDEGGRGADLLITSRRRLGRQARPGAVRALVEQGHGAGLLEDRHATRQAADLRADRRHADAGSAGQSGIQPGLRRSLCPHGARSDAGAVREDALTLESALLGEDLSPNDHRQDYLRAKLSLDEEGQRVATAFGRQDSSMLATLARADCLIVRKPNDPALTKGTRIDILPLSGTFSGV